MTLIGQTAVQCLAPAHFGVESHCCFPERGDPRCQRPRTRLPKTKPSMRTPLFRKSASALSCRRANRGALASEPQPVVAQHYLDTPFLQRELKHEQNADCWFRKLFPKCGKELLFFNLCPSCYPHGIYILLRNMTSHIWLPRKSHVYISHTFVGQLCGQGKEKKKKHT